MIAWGGKPARLEVTTYCGPGSPIETFSLDVSELRAKFRVEDFDHMVGTALGQYGYRATDGEWVEHPLNGAGLGRDALGIICSIQMNPGVVLTVKELADLLKKPLHNYDKKLPARLRSIRIAHGESGKNPRLFRSARRPVYGLWWPSEYSWIWVERILPPENVKIGELQS